MSKNRQYSLCIRKCLPQFMPTPNGADVTLNFLQLVTWGY